MSLNMVETFAPGPQQGKQQQQQSSSDFVKSPHPRDFAVAKITGLRKNIYPLPFREASHFPVEGSV